MYTRKRSRGSFESMPMDQHGNYTTCTPFSFSGSLADANGSVETMWDVEVPNFHARIRSGEVIVNPMAKITETRTSGGNQASHHRTSAGCTYNNYFDNGRVIFTSNLGGKVQHLGMSLDTSQLRTLAGTAAKANVLAPDFAGATFVAEASKTLKFLANPLNGLIRLSKRHRASYRKDRAKGLTTARNVADYIGQGWLTYRYAYMPLVYESRDAVRALDQLGKNSPRYISRGKASNDGRATLTHYGSHTYWDVGRDVVTDKKVSFRAGIIYEHSARNSFGVTLRDVADAAWEVIPFSFVADWFVNVNDYISAISPKVGVNVLGSWTSSRSETVTTATGYSTGFTRAAPYYEGTAPTSDESLETIVYARTPSVSVGLAYQPQPFAGLTGKKRVLDSLALLNGILRSR